MSLAKLNAEIKNQLAGEKIIHQASDILAGVVLYFSSDLFGMKLTSGELHLITPKTQEILDTSKWPEPPLAIDFPTDPIENAYITTDAQFVLESPNNTKIIAQPKQGVENWEFFGKGDFLLQQVIDCDFGYLDE